MNVNWVLVFELFIEINEKIGKFKKFGKCEKCLLFFCWGLGVFMVWVG